MSELALAAGTTRIDTGALPTDWKAMQLRDFCSFVQGGRLGLTKQDHYRSSGVPAFSAAGQDGYVDVVEFRDTDAVILSAIGANCGRCFLATGNWTTLANVQVIIPRPSDAIAPFLHYRVNRDDYWPRSGSAQPFIKPSDIRSCWVALPPVPQQAAIAKVLDTLDTAIHETEAIIAKLKAVKQGLLHDLLTRGIDANGELRPPQTEAPHLYKPSPLGWIPKEWDTYVFGETIEHVIDFRGRTPKKLGMDWGGGDILALSANNVQPGAIDISREAYFGSDRLYRKWMTSGDVRKGDVLLTMEAPLGNVAQIPDDARYILSQRVIALRFNARVILNDFAFWQMQCHEFRSAMARRSTGSTATGIQRAELVKLHFKAPAIWEQSLIVERLASIERKLQSERRALAKRIQQKAGLMDDLLTGRVRVTPLLQEAQQA